MVNSLSRYFEYRDDIKTILFSAGKESKFELLYSAMETLKKVERIFIVSESAEDLLKIKSGLQDLYGHNSKAPQIEWYADQNVKNKSFRTEDIDAVILDANIDAETIRSMAALQPKYLTGRIEKNSELTFAIWEQYREISEHIHLECTVADDKIDILNWDKDSNSSVELSVIFPVYNVAKYLKQCIESVTAWKAPYVEFLFVNDGSPDESRDIILQYAKQDPRIKLIDKKNGGCASARQKGLQEAQGRYIGFVDPDDYTDETMFKKLFSRAMIGSYDVCYCGYNCFYENSGVVEKIDDTLDERYSRGTTDENLIHRLIMYLRVAIWRGVYRADFLRKNDINFQVNLRRFDDLPFKIEVFALAKSVIAVPEYLYYYRLERPGQDVACDDERLYVHFDIFKYLNSRIGATRNQKLLDYLQLSKVQTHCFATRKIQRVFVKPYSKMARADFLTNNMGVLRTVLLIIKYFGKANLKTYLKIMYNLT